MKGQGKQHAMINVCNNLKEICRTKNKIKENIRLTARVHRLFQLYNENFFSQTYCAIINPDASNAMSIFLAVLNKIKETIFKI
jgi:hypothetical protein